MKKIVMYAVAGALCAATPAFARTSAEIEADIKKSEAELKKTEGELAKYKAELAADRAAKAEAKAEGDTSKQAGKSLEIGADHVKIKAKEAERYVDKKMLEHDKSKTPNEAAPAAGNH